MKIKIIWILVELFTIAFGTGKFVYTILDSYIDLESAGLYAFMIVLGFLTREWRKELFYSDPPSNPRLEKGSKKNNANRNVILGVCVVLAFTLWAKNYNEVHNINSDISRLNVEVENINYKLGEYIDQRRNWSNSFDGGFR